MSKARLAGRVQQAHEEILDQVGSLEIEVAMEKMVNQALMEDKVLEVQLDALDLKDNRDQKDRKDKKVARADLAPQAHRVNKDPRVNKEV